MDKSLLETQFQNAVSYVNTYKKGIPADTLLRLYAYYKIANENYNYPASKIPLVNAFKTNAILQAKNVKPLEAMQCYIAIVEKELK